MEFSFKLIKLDLIVNWKLSRNETYFKENFILSLKYKDHLFQSEIAPNVRYKETPEIVRDELLKVAEIFKSYDDFNIINNLILDLKLKNSTLFGVSSLILAAKAHCSGQKIFEFLKMKPPKAQKTSFTIPIMPIGEIKAYLEKIQRFSYVKIKIGQDNALDMVMEVMKHSKAMIRIDGNEAFDSIDNYLLLEDNLKKFKERIEFIEEPLKPNLHAYYPELKKRSKFPLMCDESLQANSSLEELSQSFHMVNVKLMKAGSLLNAKKMIDEAHSLGLKVMMGCMIETSLGIWYAMQFSSEVEMIDLDGHLLIKNDPFNLVRESDGALSV